MTAPPRGPTKRGRYHHGNLPAALVAAASQLIEESGVSALTLRAVARRVGVTHAAPYRHFKDKAALTAAVAQDGYARLCAALEHARRLAGLPAAVVAYVRFAASHPAAYELMLAPPEPGAPLPRASREGARRVLAALGPAGDGGERAAALWGLCHGLAALLTSGRIAPPDAAALADAAARRLLAEPPGDAAAWPKVPFEP
jgi:AcrR family transcriptional regulator